MLSPNATYRERTGLKLPPELGSPRYTVYERHCAGRLTSPITHATIVAVIAAGIVAVAHAEDRPVSVCAALDSIRDREEVTIHAHLLQTGHLTAVAEAFDNDDPCPGWRRRFFTGPSLIPLVGPMFGVRVSPDVWHKVLDFLVQQRKRRIEDPSYRPMVTVRGVFIRKTWPVIFRNRDGAYCCWGLGLDGSFPALLIVTSPPRMD
jgi:hypothetical protein